MAGFGKRVSTALQCFFTILGGGKLPQDLAREVVDLPHTAPQVAAPAPAPMPPVDTGDRAIQLLALLQRDGRLVDFLTEDLSPYSDEQIGAAVRTVHEDCQKVLDRYIKIEPILTSDEGQQVTFGERVDPASVKLIGNARDGAPVRGTLQHRGWRVAEINLPPLPDGPARRVLAQAEVEVS